ASWCQDHRRLPGDENPLSRPPGVVRLRRMDLRDRSRGDAPVANIRTIETADDVFGAWFAAFDAAHRHDFPDGPHWLEHELRVRNTPSMANDTCLLIASDEAGGVVGSAVAFFPLTDNLAMAQ